MLLSALLMFVPGHLASRLCLGRVSAGSERIFYCNSSRRLPRRRCCDTV